MTTRSATSTLAAFVMCAAAAFTAGAQQAATIPIRPLGPIVAKSTETFGTIAGVRGLPGGKVYVNDPIRRRFVQLDSTMAKSFAFADTVGTQTLYSPRGAGLVRYFGDSTLYIDATSQSMLVLDPAGKSERVLSAPKPADIGFLMPTMNGPLGVTAGNTTPGIDAQGRLIYKGNFRLAPVIFQPGQPRIDHQPDSAPLVRGNFDTRAIDTLATIRIPSMGTQYGTPNGATMKMKMVLNPLQMNDDWAVLSDGTIAIVRSQDYHIDWIDPDGTKRTTGKMPFDWRRLTDEEKNYFADSTQKFFQHLIDSLLQTMPAEQRKQITQIGGIPEIAAAPLNEIPDYLCPIGAVRPDLDGNLWILPTTSLYAKNGRLYDVVNRKGEIVERVQFPPGRALEGFGPGGVVYLSLKVGNDTYLERAHLR